MAADSIGRKPDYKLKILNKVTNARCGDAGVAWLNKDDSLSLKINPGVWIGEDSEMIYTLFPIKDAYSDKELEEMPE